MIPKLVKARLEEISWDHEMQVVEGKHQVTVQFNPDSLKLGFTNQNSGGDQRGGSAIQFVGVGVAKLSFELWVDVTAPPPSSESAEPPDVRRETAKIAFFIQPKDKDQKGSFIPPGVRFLWGTFLFEGVMESLNEELSYFSEDGRPLRAKLSVALMRQDVRFQFRRTGAKNDASSTAASGHPRHEAKQNETVADAAAAAGNVDAWPLVALANGIENPRLIAPGTMLDLRAATGVGSVGNANASAGLRGGAFVANASASSGATGGASVGGTGAASGTLQAAGGTSIGGISGGAAASARASANASFDARIRR
jgi:hypothetical protein